MQFGFYLPGRVLIYYGGATLLATWACGQLRLFVFDIVWLRPRTVLMLKHAKFTWQLSLNPYAWRLSYGDFVHHAKPVGMEAQLPIPFIVFS